MGNGLEILGAGLLPGALQEALKVGAVGDEGGGGIIALEVVGQGLGGGKDLVCLAGEIGLHLIDHLGIHQAAVGRVAIHAVVDQGAVGHQIHQVGADWAVDPEDGGFKAVFGHLFAQIPGNFVLVDPVDQAILVEKGQHRRQGAHREAGADGLLRLAVGLELLLGRAVLEGGNVGDRGVKIQDFKVGQALHHLLLAGGNGMPGGSGKADNLFHRNSSKSRRAACSFSSARARIAEASSRPVCARASSSMGISRAWLTASRGRYRVWWR